jgi:hypothetical protein
MDIPVAAPAFPAPAPAAQPAEPLNLASNPGLLLPSNHRRSGGGTFPWGKAAGLVVVAICGILVGVWALTWLQYARHHAEHDDQPGSSGSAYNSQFKVPSGDWKADPQLQGNMYANLAMSRRPSNSHFALFWKDYKTRMPTEGELLEEALDRLRHHLGKAVEWEKKPASDSARLGGKPAILIEFAGTDPDQVQMDGECLILAYRGYAYWLFTWGPQGQQDHLLPEWQKVRDGFTLLNEREGWAEKPREKAVVQGTKAVYQLSFPSDLWKKKPAEDYDPNADLVLEAFELEKNAKPHAGKAAYLKVLLLPKAADLKAAVTAAHEYLVKRLDDEGQGKVEITTVKEKGGVEADRDADIGALHGRLQKLHVHAEDSSSFERFFQLGVVQRPEGSLVVLGDCEWERRTFWEPEFKLLFEGLKGR